MDEGLGSIGQSVLRVEDAKFLTGQGLYTSDLTLPGLAHAAILYSPHANAEIINIDVSEASSQPHVLAILTASDIEKICSNRLPPLFMPKHFGGPDAFEAMRPVLAKDQVRHVGDRVAVCVAETALAAAHAAELIKVQYSEREPATQLRDAVKSGAPVVWNEAPDNICFELHLGDRAATAAAFKNAEHCVCLTATHPRVLANPMETRGALGSFNKFSNSYTLYTSTQNPHRVREVLAQQVLHIPESALRVVGPDVGGGFGMKGDCYPEEALVLLASRVIGRPVRWIATRSDSFLSDNAGRDQVFTAEMALSSEGLILAIRMDALQNLGAYMVGAALVPLTYSLKLIPNVYHVPTVDLTTRAVFTHTAPTNPYRGAGRPEAVYVTERLIDLAAKQLGLCPIEIRRRNYLRASDLPHTTATGLTYDSGDFPKAAEDCRELADWDGFEARRSLSLSAGRLRGRSITSYIQDTAAFNDRMEVHFDPSGGVTIRAGTFSHGQAHETTYKQMLSAWLSIPMGRIRVVQGDTNAVAFGRGTYASGSAHIGGNALKAATDTILSRAHVIASFLLQADVGALDFRDGAFHARGTNRLITLSDVAKVSYHPTKLPPSLRTGLEGVAYYGAQPPSFPNGCHICEVEIDAETGEIHVDRYTAVDDFGILINPMIVRGQVQGALAQGIGQALGEEVSYDTAGQLVTASFMDYTMPRASTTPSARLTFRQEPCRTNPLGVKGAGEGGTVAAPAAITNAVAHALTSVGAHVPDMPLTPNKVWLSLQTHRRGTGISCA